MTTMFTRVLIGADPNVQGKYFLELNGYRTEQLTCDEVLALISDDMEKRASRHQALRERGLAE